MRVYTRSAMVQPGASKHLCEILTRISNYSLGLLIIKDDDMHVRSATPLDLLFLWQMVAPPLQTNNLFLSTSKTVIAPWRTTVLG